MLPHDPIANPFMIRQRRLDKYLDKLIALFGRSSIVEIWPQNEPAGSTVSRGIVNGYNGAYSNVTLGQPGIGDGNTAALYNGTTSFNNVFSAPLAAVINGAEGSLFAWANIPSGTWSGIGSRKIVVLQADVNNYIQIDLTNTGTVRFLHNRQGNISVVTTAALSGPAFRFFMMTWSKSTGIGELRGYLDDIADSENPVSIATGTFTGTPAATTTVIGAASTVPATVWPGKIAPVGVLNRKASDSEVVQAHIVP